MRIFGSWACTMLLLAFSTTGPAALGVAEAQVTTSPAVPQSVEFRTKSLKLPARRAIENGEMFAFRANGTIDTLPANASKFGLKAGEFLMGRVRVDPSPLDPQILNELALPKSVVIPAGTITRDFPLILVENTRGPGGDSRLHQLQPYIAYSPLQFEPAGRRFAGRIHVGLRVVGQSEGGPIPLNTRIGFTLVADADSIEPSRLEFTEGNGAPVAVRLATSQSLDSVTVKMTRDDVPGVQAIESVPLTSVLWFENPPTQLQGYGLERRTLSLTVLGRRLATPLDVAVSANEGLVEPASVRLMPAAAATVSLTADALGPIQVSALGPGVQAAVIRIQSTPPLRFLLAALLGAFLGAAAGYLLASDKSKAAGLRSVLGAVLGGLLGVVIAIALGLNVTFLQGAGPLNTTGAVFAFAAGGAFGGLTLVNQFKTG